MFFLDIYIYMYDIYIYIDIDMYDICVMCTLTVSHIIMQIQFVHGYSVHYIVL